MYMRYFIEETLSKEMLEGSTFIEKVDHARCESFWSVEVTTPLRLPNTKFADFVLMGRSSVEEEEHSRLIVALCSASSLPQASSAL